MTCKLQSQAPTEKRNLLENCAPLNRNFFFTWEVCATNPGIICCFSLHLQWHWSDFAWFYIHSVMDHPSLDSPWCMWLTIWRLKNHCRLPMLLGTWAIGKKWQCTWSAWIHMKIPLYRCLSLIQVAVGMGRVMVHSFVLFFVFGKGRCVACIMLLLLSFYTLAIYIYVYPKP
jgi:hypothetical protein